jgi:hypothetical protein
MRRELEDLLCAVECSGSLEFKALSELRLVYPHWCTLLDLCLQARSNGKDGVLAREAS